MNDFLENPTGSLKETNAQMTSEGKEIEQPK